MITKLCLHDDMNSMGDSLYCIQLYIIFLTPTLTSTSTPPSVPPCLYSNPLPPIDFLPLPTVPAIANTPVSYFSLIPSTTYTAAGPPIPSYTDLDASKYPPSPRRESFGGFPESSKDDFCLPLTPEKSSYSRGMKRQDSFEGVSFGFNHVVSLASRVRVCYFSGTPLL